MVVRVVGRLTGGQAPELKVQERQQRRVALALGKGVAEPDGALEGGEESDRLAIDRLWRVGADEVNRFSAVVGVGWQRRRCDQCWICSRHRAAIEMVVRQQS